MKATLRYYFSVFLRRLPWFLIPTAALAAAGVIIAMSLPPAYVSQTRFLIEGSQIPAELAPPTVAMSPLQQLQLVQQRVNARGNLLDVARRLNVFPNIATMNADDIVDQMRQKTRINLIATRNGLPQMVISFEGRTGQVSAAVINEYLNLIQQADVESRAGRATQTLQFFQQEMERLNVLLSEQNQKLLDFQNRNADALPDGQAFRISQQTQMQDRVAQMDRDIASLIEQRARIISVFETTGRIEAIGGDNRTPQERQLDDLRDQLNQAMAVYAPSNPRVKVLQSRIAQLEATIAATKGNSAATSPLDAQLAEIDSRIKNLQNMQAEANQRLNQLTDQIARTPANAVTLSALMRDHDSVQSQYNRAAASAATASASERVELQSQGQRITIIEQPAVPSSPSKPNRVLIAAGGIGAGMALGLGLIVLLELLNRSPRRPEDLVKKLGIMPLATIPYIRSNQEMVWQRSLKAALILLILIGIPALVWGVHTYYQPLDLLAQRVMNKIGL